MPSNKEIDGIFPRAEGQVLLDATLQQAHPLRHGVGPAARGHARQGGRLGCDERTVQEASSAGTGGVFDGGFGNAGDIFIYRTSRCSLRYSRLYVRRQFVQLRGRGP